MLAWIKPLALAIGLSRGTILTDNDAREILKLVPSIHTENELRFVQAVTRGESYYGQAWKAGKGKGSHNWGAVKQFGGGPFFLHDDETPNQRFKVYDSDLEGAEDAAHFILRDNVRAALADNDWRSAVTAMKDNRYFTLPLENYQASIYDSLVNSGGMPSDPLRLYPMGLPSVGRLPDIEGAAC